MITPVACTPFIHIGVCPDCNEGQIAIFDDGVTEDWDGTVQCIFCKNLAVQGLITSGAN